MRMRPDMKKGAYISKDSPYHNYFQFLMIMRGLITVHMMAGGEWLVPKL